MNILLITPLYPPLTGGAAEEASVLTAEFNSCGEIASFVVLTQFTRQKPLREKIGKTTVLRFLPPRDVSPGGRFLNGLVGYAWTYSTLMVSIPLIIWRHKIHAMILHSRLTRRPLVRYLRLLNRPMLVSFSDIMARPWRMMLCDGVICYTRNSHNRAVECGIPPSEAHFIPYPMNWPDRNCIPALPEKFASFRPYILFVGTVTSSKGIYELLEGFRGFRENHHTFRLVIAGINQEGYKFVEAIQREEAVVYVGAVAKEEVWSLMENSEIVILPSKSEGLPRACLEALWLHKKVVLPPGIPEFNEYCPGFVLPEVSPEAIKRKLEETLSTEASPAYPFTLHNAKNGANAIFAVLSEIVCVGR